MILIKNMHKIIKLAFVNLYFATFLLLIPASGICEEVPPDTTAPTGSITIEGEETFTSTRNVSIALSANDAGSGVSGYYLSENSAAPLPASFTQITTTQTFSSIVSFTLSIEDGSKTVHAWFIDGEGNISNAFSDSIILDMSAPGNIQISIHDASGFISTSLVTVTLSATDLTGIKGWYLSENLNDPSASLFEPVDPAVTSFSASVSYTLSKSTGLKTLYVWFIDIFDHMSAPASADVDFSYGWVRVQGTEMSDGAERITMDDNGNIYIVGYTNGDHNEILDPVEAFVSKISPSGDVIWTGIVNEATYNTSAEHVAVDSNGNVYIGGPYNNDISSNPQNSDSFIAKYDANGNRKWLKIFEAHYTQYSTRINGLGIDSFNNLYTIGYTNGNLVLSDTITISYSEGSGNFLAKYDGNGNLLWGKDLYPEETVGDMLTGNGGFFVDKSGNIFIAGTANDGFDGQTGYGSWDILLAKFNSSGEKQWTKLHGTANAESASDLCTDSYGNIYVSGGVTETDTSNFLNGYVKKFDSSGDAVWTNDEIFTTESYDSDVWPGGISVDSRGNVYVTGNIQISYGGENSFISKLFLRKYNANGTLLWTKRTPRNDPKAESGSDVFTGPSDMVYLAGRVYNYYEGDGFAGQPSYPTYGRSDILIWKSVPDSLFDMTHPVAGELTINNGDATSIAITVTLNLNATDNIGITGYAVSEDNVIPPPSAFTLVEETTEYIDDVEYTFESTATGEKTVYVWYRDAFGNFSKAVSASIEVTGDVDAPVGVAPVIDGGAEQSVSMTVSVAISATDNVAVTGYFLTEGYTSSPVFGDFTMIDNPSPDFTKTVSFTLQNTTAGRFTIYAWFIDAAGNISDSVTASGSMKDTRPPVTAIDPAPGYYDGPITITLTATDDSDRYIGDTLFSQVVTYYTVNDGGIQTYSGSGGTGPFEITPPAVIKFLSADNYGLNDFMGADANVEAVQTATYGVRKVISGEISGGETASQKFSVKAGSDLGIIFSLEDGTSLESELFRAPLSTACSTTLTLKRPDLTTYGEYSYTEGYTRIIVTGAAAGEWTLEIDRSGCDATANFETVLVESPVDGNLPGIPSMARLIKFLKILSDYDIEGLDDSHDIDGDGKIGIAEAIRMIRDIAGMQ